MYANLITAVAGVLGSFKWCLSSDRYHLISQKIETF